MKKLGLAATSAVAVGAPGLASADASNNDTTNDAFGYCQANHIANFNIENGVQLHGIGHLRSEMTRSEIAASAGRRAPAQHCVDTQDRIAPISNDG